MNVSWLTCQPNDRRKMPSLLLSRLMRPFARREFAVVLDGFAVDILQVERGIHDAAIAAETLGFIERGVGFSHQRGLVERRAVSGGDAHADGDVSAAGGCVRNAQSPNRQPDALDRK